MEQLNRIEICGIVGNVRRGNVQGKVIARMTVATNYIYKSQDGTPVIETTWHSVTCWEGKDIDKSTLESIEKGTKIHLVGRLRNQRFTKADGTEHTLAEILVNKLTKVPEEEILVYQK